MNSVIFSILLNLLTNKRLTREMLAEKYEVSTRTISRYIDVLIESGVPILSVPGVGGGYTLPDDYKLERGFLTEAEIKRIGEALDKTAKDYDDKMSSIIMEKLNALDEKKENVRISPSEYLVIDDGPWSSHNLYRNKLDVMKKAIRDGKTVQIKYTDRHEAFSSRLVDPYYLVLKEYVWYVYAFCHSRQDFRLFKLSRINHIFTTNEKFERRSDSNVIEKLNERFDASETVNLLIEFSCTVLPQIEEWLGADSVFEYGLDYRASATVAGGNELLAKILSFGSSVKVLSPQSLKDDVIAECKRVVKNI